MNETERDSSLLSTLVPSLSCSQFSQGKEPSTLSVAELTENFARNHERRMAQKVRGRP